MTDGQIGRYRATHETTRPPRRQGRVFQQYTDTHQFARTAGALAV